ncbi:hypothetical protein IQ06DRAFT_120217 [Phaeosphaeriaceae sp. SRC1lsM3a]|nr:hypothetical protein IQ06DRAFT_120217 [Stagonospora sp. SRC1lsM3a]
MMISPAWSTFTALVIFISLLPPASRTAAAQFTQFANKRTGCMQQRGLFYTLIPLSTDSDPELHFAIKTGYTAYYPKALQNAVQVAGFNLLTLSTMECGWQKARSVMVKAKDEVGRHRGDLYWKYGDLHWGNSNDTGNSFHWIAVNADHIPPNTGVLPRDGTLDALERVLQDNEPAADVYVLLTICLSYVSGFLAFYLLALFAVTQLRRVRKPNPGMGDSEGIGLDAMKNYRTGTPAPEDALPAMPVATPRYMVRTSRDFSQSGTEIPPPRYSAAFPSLHVREDNRNVSRLKQGYGVQSMDRPFGSPTLL